MLAVLMGGRSAEEIFLGHITTGAGNDIERATDIARNMVCEWGMSELGPLAYGKKDEAIFLGREITQHRDYSEDTAIQIDKEVKRIVNGGYEAAKKLLSNNRETSNALHRHSRREVIDANEVKLLMKASRRRISLPPPPPTQAAPSTDPKVVRPELRPAPGFTRGENPAKA
jgi:cell division protease FtsH